ncbi:MAG: M1 family peptidase, partial [Bacteroidetes bacterium]
MLPFLKSPFKLFLVLLLLGRVAVFGQGEPKHGTKFEQLGPMLHSPNEYRGADGAPGPEYWQQTADYVIECQLDVNEQRLDGNELITYHNNSPNTLRYIWLQLDENQHAADANNQRFEPSSISPAMSEQELRALEPWRELDKFGVNIHEVTQKNGTALEYSINKTMMRIMLPQPLGPGEDFSFRVKWHYYLIDRINSISWGRGGYEYFSEDNNYLFTITQWYPRVCVYSDFEGWQNNQFTGRGEFALNFGNFDVKMTLPEDYVVGSTGECQNYSQMLSGNELKRWKEAQSSNEPIEIVTLEEAKSMEKTARSTKTKTWHYKAENVRDFAWTASRKFIWDAMSYENEGGDPVMCMSYYPKEAYPIYRKYSTKAVEHTLKSYSKYSIPYPYPVAISVEAANGMEYPMICFNPGRAEEDGTYTEGSRLSAISVIIHEVGYNYFPMIIHSDER